MDSSGLPEGECFLVHRSTREAGTANGFWTFSRAAGDFYPDANGYIRDSFFAASTKFHSGVPVSPSIYTNFHLYNARMRANSEWSSRLNGQLLFAHRRISLGIEVPTP